MTTDLLLSADEARVLGVLIEKSMTTPDQYPLSLNALVNGCNQKSNRNPVSSVGASQAKLAAQGLREKQLAVVIWPPTGSRTEKFRHVAEAGLGVDEKSAAVIAELLLRRAQMPGELRTRVSRMAPIDSQAELKQILDNLVQRGLVTRVPPSPGSRTERYDHLLSADVTAETASPTPSEPAPGPSTSPSPQAPTPAASPSLDEILRRLRALEARVTQLEESAPDS